MVNRTFIGISAYNDKLRFNLYWRPLNKGLENLTSVHRSEIFDLSINLNNANITNSKDFGNFLSIVNILSKQSPSSLDKLYLEFMSGASIDTEYKEYQKEMDKKIKDEEESGKNYSKKSSGKKYRKRVIKQAPVSRTLGYHY